MLTRRHVVAGAAAAFIAVTVRAADGFAAIEADLAGGRLGFAAVDLHTRRRLSHRADERFALCSTFKLPLVAAVLAQIDAGRLIIDRRIAIGADDLLDYAPAVRAALPQGGMTVAELCEAALVLSDNSAANLLLPLAGGPTGLTRFMRAHGGGTARLDRTEPTLNSNLPGDPRDTATPADMAGFLGALLVRKTLRPQSQARLIGWMEACRTGAKRLRSAFPTGWRAGDKTGSGARGAVNDLAFAWPSGRTAPIVLACYVDAPGVSLAAAERAHVAAARLAVAAFA